MRVVATEAAAAAAAVRRVVLVVAAAGQVAKWARNGTAILVIRRLPVNLVAMLAMLATV